MLIPTEKEQSVEPEKTISGTGLVCSIQICTGHRKPMKIVNEIEAIENLGLKGDRHALPDSSRQVLLMEIETLASLGLETGIVKENITTEGIELMKLSYGQRLQIGGQTVLEITKPCAPCSRMEEIRAGLLKEIAGKRGMLARVVKGGIIRTGDAVTLMRK